MHRDFKCRDVTPIIGGNWTNCERGVGRARNSGRGTSEFGVWLDLDSVVCGGSRLILDS